MLRHNTFRKWAVVLVFLLLWTGMSLGGMEPVCFRHKVTDRIKIGCTQFIGKHDAFPRYECLEKPFDPKDEWELIPCPRSSKKTKNDVPKTGEESHPSEMTEKDNTDAHPK